MEERTKNKYGYPVGMDRYMKMSYSDSPAHMGNLKYSVDFIVKEGTPVKAARAGTVVDLKSDSDKGGTDKSLEPFCNFIEIRHDNGEYSGEYSEYEHLKKDGVLVKIGEEVKQGQVIGYSGATGWLAHLGPHLHFMVGRYGKTKEDYETLKIVWENE